MCSPFTDIKSATTSLATPVAVVDKNEEILKHLLSLQLSLSELSKKETPPLPPPPAPAPVLSGLTEIEAIVASSWDYSLGDFRPWIPTLTRQCGVAGGGVAITKDLLVERLETTMACVRINQGNVKKEQDMELLNELKKLSSTTASVTQSVENLQTSLKDNKDNIVNCLREEMDSIKRSETTMVKGSETSTVEKQEEFFKAFSCGYRAGFGRFSDKVISEEALMDAVREVTRPNYNNNSPSKVNREPRYSRTNYSDTNGRKY